MSMSSNGGSHDAATGQGATFRNKAAFMKTWRPENAPSNRDRLELYALHKQAVSADAPNSIPAPSSATVAEKAKYQAWRAKRGLSQQEAMSLYIAECDRQLRVYGNSVPPPSQTPSNTPMLSSSNNNTINNIARHGDAADANNNNNNALLTPRGLAAVPLLCAAAAESRVAYLRRLAQTAPENAWWSRQEPLCANPGTLAALPELFLLLLATTVERMSLQWAGSGGRGHIVPPTVLQSFLWPVHNCLLSLWIGLILISTIVGGTVTLASTILWGARRTGVPLLYTWREELEPAARVTATTLTEPHQPMSARLVGLVLLPYGTVVNGMTSALCDAVGLLWGSVAHVLIMALTWWYWLLVVPWLCACLLGAATMSGSCFALIDLAGI